MAQLTVTLRQPTQVSTSVRSDGVLDTEDHIPGWVVRGAFAAAWIRQFGEPTRSTKRGLFQRLFEGEVRFGPLFIGAPPPPLSAHEHKYQVTPNCRASHVDAALLDLTTVLRECQDCQQTWEPMRPRSSTVPIHTRTSVVIDRDTDVAAKGLLFSRRRLPARSRVSADGDRESTVAPVTLRGHLTSDDSTLLSELANLSGLRIGGRRTTHGAVSVALDSAADSDTGGGGDPAALPLVRNDGVIIVRLISPAVFVDGEGRPSPQPSNEELSSALGVDAKVLRSWKRWGSVGGWHAASGLPKPTETVVTGGSTYAVWCSSVPTPAAVKSLVRRGLGLRRHEGFGHIGGPFQLPTTLTATADLSERLAQTLTEDNVKPYLVLGSDGGRIPADLSSALRGALADAAEAPSALALAKGKGGRIFGAQSEGRAGELLALPPARAEAIIRWLEQR